ncbi:nucleoid-associated protein [Flagellimonas aequoris]|nr:nucleoid-associated protein [Allomuricauda aequoris]TXK00663.1 nucleoid-associated protein [Allomuricauda aequoris]
MEIKNIFLHHIDVANSLITEIKVIEDSANLNTYIESLVKDILDNPNRRFYNWKDGDTEVKNSLDPLKEIGNESEKYALNNAKRLLEKESKAQEQVNKMNVEMQKGSLLHLSIESDGTHKTIICKVEHDEVMNEVNFEYIRGLNTRKKLFKAILIYYNSNGQIEHNYVHDKNSSKYWWDDFLELEPIITDDDNTENSLNEIDKCLTRYRKKYYVDYLILRNSFLGHFRNRDTLNFSDLVNDVFKNYTPLNKQFPKDRLLASINKLPEKNLFDTTFNIAKNKINKRKKTSIRLASNLFLNIDDFVENLKNLIDLEQKNGNKYVRIKSEDGYDKLEDLLNKL